MTDKIERSPQELHQKLEEQVYLIKKSSHDFDKGDLIEGVRLATHLRTLLNDTRNSTSLLKSLGIKDSIRYLNSALPRNPSNLIHSYLGFLSITFQSDGANNKISYKPWLEDYCIFKKTNEWQSFDDWWDTPIIIDNQGNSFTRKDIILIIADKEGGAHVDKKLDKNYSNLTTGTSMNWSFQVSYSNGQIKKSDIPGIQLPSVRQIAFELIKSLDTHYYKKQE